MSSHSGVRVTLEVLADLRDVVCEFTERERKLTEDLAARIAALRRRRDATVAELSRALDDNVRSVEAEFVAATKGAESSLARRKAWILRAHRTSTNKALEDVENAEGRRKHKLQTETLQSRRSRETGLASAESTLAEFKAALAEHDLALTVLENLAQKTFKGYRRLRRLLSVVRDSMGPDGEADEHQLAAELGELLKRITANLGRFRRRPLPAIFRLTPVLIGLVLCQVPAALALQHFGINALTTRNATISTVICLLVGGILHYVSGRRAEPAAREISGGLSTARRLHTACTERAESRYLRDVQQIENAFHDKTQWIEREWSFAVDAAETNRESRPREINEKASRVTAKCAEQHQRRIERLEERRAHDVQRLSNETESHKRDVNSACAESESKLNVEMEGNWRELEAAWKLRTEPMCSTVAAMNASADKHFPPWERTRWEHWTPPLEFGDAARFGQLNVDLGTLCRGVPKDLRLALPGGTRASFPLLLTYPGEGSILFETKGGGRAEIIASLNNIILRLLSCAPAGRLNFTIIDPVALGESFSGIMHLADYAEHLIHGRIWTQPGQIEQQLSDLNEHMEKVIQMYLRNEYATIAEYNEKAGNIAEKYHFVVVADFPANFSDAAARRLLRIAASGARCGVFTLIHWDQRQALPQDFVAEDLRRSSVCLTCDEGRLTIAGTTLMGAELVLDAPPAPDFAIEFIQRVGMHSRDSNRIEVPFSQVMPSATERWTLDATAEVRVPIGRTGATKLQYLALGKGTRQHALVAGKTGSGKSTLFHVIITNLALWCSPEQVEFYLIDFKKGVEFKCYATHRLPHARVVAIESDREFGLSVLQRLDEELKRRGELFRKLGVQDLIGYKRAGGRETIPRALLIIDEFQEFFVEDDKLAQTASLLLDRIVRQGRAFGIHVLLGSQTLGGAYTVARTTLGQMAVRIALQCNETDAYLIMDENNAAPRLLSRPGEGIYNDASGAVEGNSPFQTVWLPDHVRDSNLSEVRSRADASPTRIPGPIVFEGNAPADVDTNPLLRELLEAESIRSSGQSSIWLGAPNSIKGPTEVVFRRQSGNNLLFVGQREETLLALFSTSLVALAAQHSSGTVRLIVCDASQPGSTEYEYLEQVAGIIPHPVVVVRQNDLPNAIARISEEIFQRCGDESPDSAPTTFLFINGLQKFGRLRYEDDFGFSSGDSSSPPNPASTLNRLICEGTRLGCHVIVACDTYSNVNRYLSRQALGEFEMRVLFQMSVNDSASLIDSPRAGSLGLHRAIFYNAQQGTIETFRPYALPDSEWVESAGRNLGRLLAR